MTEGEKELIFSKTMTNTVEGSYIRDVIQDYFDSQEQNQSKMAGFLQQQETLSKKSKVNKSGSNFNSASHDKESPTMSQDPAANIEITDKATLYEMNQRKIRDEAFQKLKAAIHWKEAEKV